MDFCKKCQSFMLPKKEKNRTVLICQSCGYKQTGEGTKLVEKIPATKPVRAVDVQIKGTMPMTDAECPKCGHKRAYFRSEQTRASDEPETLFFTCVKCNSTWRDYS